MRDRYQLAAQVSGAVACGWIGQWFDARRSGDHGREQAAVDALLGSRSWPVLREMQAKGDYPLVVWEYADAIAGRGPVHGVGATGCPSRGPTGRRSAARGADAVGRRRRGPRGPRRRVGSLVRPLRQRADDADPEHHEHADRDEREQADAVSTAS